eukprot:252319-Amphidinium_carterae.1
MVDVGVALELEVSFEPDTRHPEVSDLGADEYRVRVQLRDLVECTAVAMPGEDESDKILFYLQLYVRTHFTLTEFVR